jgi:hypothetical protein
MKLIRLLIIYCTKKAEKYGRLSECLLAESGYSYVYAIGTMEVKRKRWLRRVKWLLEISKRQ